MSCKIDGMCKSAAACFLGGCIYDEKPVTENNVAAQAGDEPIRAVVALAWKWHDKAVASGFAASEPAQELFALLGWPDRGVSPRATADVERDAARWRYWRKKYGAECRMIPGAIWYADTPEKLDIAVDLCMPAIATTKPGA